MDLKQEADIGSLVERAFDQEQQANRDAAARDAASVEERHLARMEAAFEQGESHLRQMPSGPRN